MTNTVKISFTVIFLLISIQLFAQRVNGVIIDKFTSLPIQNVNISTTLFTTFTSIAGKFTIPNTRIADTIRFSCIGYKPYYLIINRVIVDSLVIKLEQNSVQLREVTIKGINNYKMDSLRRRNEFAKLFNYKSPAFKDIFIPKASYSNVPYGYNTALNNTTSILSINLLSAIGLINKGNAPLSKLQKVLIKDEEDRYVDHIFSKRKVTSLTTLKDDSLSEFMNKYRPAAMELRKMTEYDLILYIKNKYKQFKNKN